MCGATIGNSDAIPTFLVGAGEVRVGMLGYRLEVVAAGLGLGLASRSDIWIALFKSSSSFVVAVGYGNSGALTPDTPGAMSTHLAC